MNSFRDAKYVERYEDVIFDYHKDYKGLCIEFKSPTNNYHVSEAQRDEEEVR